MPRMALPHPQALPRRGRQHHRGARGGQRQALLPRLDVRPGGSGHHAAGAPGLRPPRSCQSRQDLPHTRPLWRIPAVATRAGAGRAGRLPPGDGGVLRLHAVSRRDGILGTGGEALEVPGEPAPLACRSWAQAEAPEQKWASVSAGRGHTGLWPPPGIVRRLGMIV